MYLHLTAADLLRSAVGSRPNDNPPLGSEPGLVARWEDVGPMLLSQLRDLLRRFDIVVKPVIDPAGVPASDRYEVPMRMREAMHLTKPGDCFPYASNTGRRMDADHTDRFVPMDRGGPPGQTRPDNLGFLTRRHHRIKTLAAGWHVTQPRSGLYVWRSPHGRLYLVDEHGTTTLGRLR